MDNIINRKSLIFIALIVVSILSFTIMQTMIKKMQISSNINFAVTSLSTVNDIISQIKEENNNEKNNNSSSNSNDIKSNNKPSLKDEIEKSKSRLSKEEYKAAKSNYNKMTEHIDKLEKYKKNPYEYDNQSLLRNAPNEQIRQKIIQTRISHLEKEIQTFYNNIVKIIK